MYTDGNFIFFLLFMLKLASPAPPLNNKSRSNPGITETPSTPKSTPVVAENFTLAPSINYNSPVEQAVLRPGPFVSTQAEFTLPPPNVNGNTVVALKQAPVAQFDCTSAQLSVCGQVAWTDLGLALSGITAKYELCSKYTPSTSCISRALASCALDADKTTRSMLISIAKVFVTWCYDGGKTLAALDLYTECYAAALLQAVTFDHCLTEMDPNSGLIKSFLDSKKSEQGLSLPGVFNALMGNFGTSTVRCMYDSILLTCGEKAADIALKPAMDEFELRMPTLPTTTPSPNATSTAPYTFAQKITPDLAKPGPPSENIQAPTSGSKSPRRVSMRNLFFCILVVMAFAVMTL